MTTEKWDWTVDRIAFFDVETTGLPPPRGPNGVCPLMLEVALVLTDQDLKVIDRFNSVIWHPPDVLDSVTLDPKVEAMHSESGLLEELRSPLAAPASEVERVMIEVLDQNPSQIGRPVVWAGFSPSAVDRPLIARDMPRLYQRIHYRTIDVSSLVLVARNWNGLSPERGASKHRALADAMASVETLRKLLWPLSRT